MTERAQPCRPPVRTGAPRCIAPGLTALPGCRAFCKRPASPSTRNTVPTRFPGCWDPSLPVSAVRPSPGSGVLLPSSPASDDNLEESDPPERGQDRPGAATTPDSQENGARGQSRTSGAVSRRHLRPATNLKDRPQAPVTKEGRTPRMGRARDARPASGAPRCPHRPSRDLAEGAPARPEGSRPRGAPRVGLRTNHGGRVCGAATRAGRGPVSASYSRPRGRRAGN